MSACAGVEGRYFSQMHKSIRTLIFFNCDIPVISVVLREITISDSTGEPTVSMESEIVRVVSLGTKGISEKTREKIRSSGPAYFKPPSHRAVLISFNSLPHNPDFERPPWKRPFENIVGKGENNGNQHFLLFPSMFSTLPKANFIFFYIYI